MNPLLRALLAATVLAACSSTETAPEDAGGPTEGGADTGADAARDAGWKGTNAGPTADGAPGACCAPSVGGCADVGGYRADGDCTKGRICDNMCEQRIVDDVHGCKKMVYKLPPYPTTAAGPGPCTVSDGGADASSDASSDASTDASAD
jgi:hypothetical protein